MRLSELMGKEVINLYDGSRVGTGRELDLLLDPQGGRILGFIMPCRSRWWGWGSEPREVVIPWESVRKVGTEFIIVNLNPTYTRLGD
ncbi:MAG TPA: YlmC/YmxH family sporulation protein [Moorella mulderi]|nr:YlmC/YmxH family sporulation protein [Moorella mulderi]